MANSPVLLVRPNVADQLSKDDLAWIRKVKNRLYDALGCPQNSEATIVLTDDTEIQELNREWRDVDEPTDVLSFAYQEAEDGFLVPELLGDVIISLPTARRYAADAQHATWIGENGLPRTPWSFQLELAFLLSHGFLHLLGFDHLDPDEERVMRAAEREVFEALIAVRKKPRRQKALSGWEDLEDEAEHDD